MPAERITPPLWALVDVRLIITDVVDTVGIITVIVPVSVLWHPAQRNTADKEIRKKAIFRNEGIFMQIKR